MANRHKGEVSLPREEGQPPLLLIFDGTAYAHLEDKWGVGMKGVMERISNWDETNIKLGDLGDLLNALAQRHQPTMTRAEAMDLIGFPTPDMAVVEAMMEAVKLSMPKETDAGEASPPRAKARKSGTGSRR